MHEGQQHSIDIVWMLKLNLRRSCDCIRCRSRQTRWLQQKSGEIHGFVIYSFPSF